MATITTTKKKTVLKKMLEIESRAPNLYEALAKDDKSLIK
jgi:hypothetical protein